MKNAAALTTSLATAFDAGSRSMPPRTSRAASMCSASVYHSALALDVSALSACERVSSVPVPVPFPSVPGTEPFRSVPTGGVCSALCLRDQLCSLRAGARERRTLLRHCGKPVRDGSADLRCGGDAGRFVAGCDSVAEVGRVFALECGDVTEDGLNVVLVGADVALHRPVVALHRALVSAHEPCITTDDIGGVRLHHLEVGLNRAEVGLEAGCVSGQRVLGKGRRVVLHVLEVIADGIRVVGNPLLVRLRHFRTLFCLLRLLGGRLFGLRVLYPPLLACEGGAEGLREHLASAVVYLDSCARAVGEDAGERLLLVRLTDTRPKLALLPPRLNPLLTGGLSIGGGELDRERGASLKDGARCRRGWGRRRLATASAARRRAMRRMVGAAAPAHTEESGEGERGNASPTPMHAQIVRRTKDNGYPPRGPCPTLRDSDRYLRRKEM